MPERGSCCPLWLAGEVVAYGLRTQTRVRAVVAHAAWRVDAGTAGKVVLDVSGTSRTPAPLRLARQMARSARSDSAAQGQTQPR